MIHPFTKKSAVIKILWSLPGQTNPEKERQRKEAGVHPSSTTRGCADAFCISHKLLHLLQKFPPLLPLCDVTFHSYLRSLPGRTNAEKVGFERQRKDAGFTPLQQPAAAPMLSAFRIRSCTSCKSFSPYFPSMIYPFAVSCGACPGGYPYASRTPRRRGSY